MKMSVFKMSGSRKVKRGNIASRASRTFVAVFLIAVMVLTMNASASFASSAEQPTGKLPGKTTEAKPITVDFEALEEKVAVQGVAFGTELADLNIPTELAGTDADGEPVVVKDIQWVPEPEYDGTISGEYLFRALLPEGYVLNEKPEATEPLDLKLLSELGYTEEQIANEEYSNVPKVRITVLPEPEEATSLAPLGEGELVPMAAKQIPINIGKVTIKHQGVTYEGDAKNPPKLTLDIGQSVYFTIEWSVDDDYDIVDGDYGYVDILKGFPVPAYIDPEDPPKLLSVPIMMDSTIIGDMIFDENQRFTLMFNDALKGLEGKHGSIFISRVIEYTPEYDPNKDTEDFEEGYGFELHFNPKGIKDGDIAKQQPTGDFDATRNKLTRIGWQIDVNKNLTNIKGDAEMTDVINTGTGLALHQFDTANPSNIKVYPLDVEVSSGKLTPDTTHPLTYGTDYEVVFDPTDGTSKMTVKWLKKDALDGKAYRILFSTIPTADTSADLKSYSYKNTSYLGPIKNNVYSQAEFSWNTTITNEKLGTVSKDGGYVTWTININKNNNPYTPETFYIQEPSFATIGLGAPYDYELKLNTPNESLWKSTNAQGVATTPLPTTSSTGNIRSFAFNSTTNESLGFNLRLAGSPVDKNGKATASGYTLTFKTKFLKALEDDYSGKYENIVKINEKDYKREVTRPAKPGPEPEPPKPPGPEDAKFSKDKGPAGKILFTDTLWTLQWTSTITAGNTDLKGEVNSSGTVVSGLRLNDYYNLGSDPDSGRGLQMKLDPSSVMVTVTHLNGSSTTLTQASGAPADVNQFQVVDYGLGNNGAWPNNVFDQEGNAANGGFQIVFHKDFVLKGHTTNGQWGEKMTIAYNTLFTPTYGPQGQIVYKKGEVVTELKSLLFRNTMNAFGSQGGKVWKKGDWEDYPAVNDMQLFRNGSKEGRFASTGIIEWTFYVNTNNVALPDGLLMTDVFPELQDIDTPPDGIKDAGLVKYLENSLKVYRNDVLITDPNEYTFALTGDDPTKGFDLKIKVPGNDTFKVVYQTQLFGKPLPAGSSSFVYKNTVKIDGWANLEATVKNTVSQMLMKAGNAEEVKGTLTGTALWSIKLNAANAEIEEPMLVDTLGPGHILDEDSIKVYRGASATGTLLIAHDPTNPTAPYDYVLEVDKYSSATETVFKITFHKDYVFKDTHFVTYSSTITQEGLEQDSIGNKAIFTGKKVIIGDDEKDIAEEYMLMGAIGTGYKVPVIAKKVDIDNPSLALGGAIFRFELLDPLTLEVIDFVGDKVTAYGDSLLDPPELDGCPVGTIAPVYLPYGTYRVTEIKPPSGYVLTYPNSRVFVLNSSVKKNAYGGSDGNDLIAEAIKLIGEGKTPPPYNVFELIFANPSESIDVQVDKDTLQITSAAFVDPSDSKVNNVGKEDERIRSDVNFRALSNINASDFVVIDSLEAITNGEMRMDALWTPAPWGDMDNYFEIWWATESDPEVRLLAGPLQIFEWDTSDPETWDIELQTWTVPDYTQPIRHKLDFEGEVITHLEFRYGEVKPGFTSFIGEKTSINGENRDVNGNRRWPDDFTDQNKKDTIATPDAINPLSILHAFSAQEPGTQLLNNALQGLGVANTASISTFEFNAPVRPGITEDGIDWTPPGPPKQIDPTDPNSAYEKPASNFSEELWNLIMSDDSLSPFGGSINTLASPSTLSLKPITYLYSATKPMTNVDIVSSASSYIYMNGTKTNGATPVARDQDVVLTRPIKTFTTNPNVPKFDHLSQDGSNVNEPQVVSRRQQGGRPPKLGDDALFGMWFLLMAGAAVCMALLARIYVTSRREKNVKGGR